MGTRDRILDAAAEIMRDRGVVHATTKEIAKVAGYSEAALYKHFSDKEDIILNVLRHRMPDPAAARPEPGQSTVEDNLTAMARDALSFYQQSLPLLGGLLAQPQRMAAHRDSMRRHGAGPGHAIANIAEYLRAERDLGRVAADADVLTAASMLDGTCFHQAFLRYYESGAGAAPAPDDLARGLARTLISGLGSCADDVSG
ncbi:TetR/AcrR family transcriptional regulator [Nocardia implantans]|uniref:TetR/AcrR family transcriptional regulator n=1 Tax=Nocardia implantans TaxID=3108168 RepID=A0ABU6B105_9NOCA|nr:MULTISPECIES: TetR/AcrR family transcriptional regulator [unclassified Nocardia]MBF6195502.1 TetR/AcrR family transcriptional regulator [Nocardia beijingensis]MEA3531988.1 TetR/AcrR family transcriptional regulator [Nocardia sp. CDC192]MEB3513422.1 TetR/AcrR family transcriptional regulator [Nocardia sp. CDC186]